ncbi:MAG: hypothetical protein P0116_08135 [Candidatus Nitrosocosmicus sp.]|nr:hypothetical protein [Candidatus Nitrosocosmicus sp.]
MKQSQSGLGGVGRPDKNSNLKADALITDIYRIITYYCQSN